MCNNEFYYPLFGFLKAIKRIKNQESILVVKKYLKSLFRKKEIENFFCGWGHALSSIRWCDDDDRGRPEERTP